MTDLSPTDFRTLCAELVAIEDALSGGSVQFSNQSQALDGYSALATFRNVAARARAALAQPPSLKEQALALIDGCTDPEGDYLDDNALSIIRRALEALND